MSKTPEIKIIGRCTLDTEALLKEMPSVILLEERSGSDSCEKIWQSHYNTLYLNLSKDNRGIYEEAYHNSFRYHLSKFGSISDEEKLEEIKILFSKRLGKDIEAANAMHLPFKCYLAEEDICIVSLSGVRNMDAFWLFPARFVKVEEYKDYKALTGSERKALITGKSEKTTDIITADDLSYNEIAMRKEETTKDIDCLMAEMKDVEEAKAEGLSELKAEIDRMTAKLEAQKKAMLDELEAKKNDLEEKLEVMNQQIFRLDSEIYNIRCYTGEVSVINKLRTGAPAEESSPIVFYQKMRYMDEELGRLSGLRNIDFGKAKYFENVLAENDDVVSAFIPANRGIALIRVSRKPVNFFHAESYSSILNQFEKWHGMKIAILIKDGENLYISWTDDDRINFSEDAFLKPGERQIAPEEKAFLKQKKTESDKHYKDRVKAYQQDTINEFLGRYYVFSLLQGMLDRSLIKLPERINLTESKYLIFSMADAWLDTNKYGTFGEMITRSNKSVKSGDHVLMTSSLTPHYTYPNGSSAWQNDRGIGDKNRTWDVQTRDNTVYRINKVDHIADYKYMLSSRDKDAQPRTRRSVTDTEYREMINNTPARYWQYSDIEKIEGSDEYRYYVSLLKECSGGEARANFQVYKDEFINLTFMNSVWLEYVLTNSKSGNVEIGGRSVDFAYTIPYIKTALSYCKKRERKVAEWMSEINPDILRYEEWPVKLSEWMLEHGIHNFSEFRTKQFCKAYNCEEDNQICHIQR